MREEINAALLTLQLAALHKTSSTHYSAFVQGEIYIFCCVNKKSVLIKVFVRSRNCEMCWKRQHHKAVVWRFLSSGQHLSC